MLLDSAMPGLWIGWPRAHSEGALAFVRGDLPLPQKGPPKVFGDPVSSSYRHIRAYIFIICVKLG